MTTMRKRLAVVGGIVFLGIISICWIGEASERDALRVLVHLNTPDSAIQGAGLKNITNILAEAPDTRVEVVCHSGGIGLVTKGTGEHGATVEALMKKGVQFVACENTMRQKSIRKEDLLTGVGTVPSGALEVVRRQFNDGYAYFKP